jgi:hypothetical protein
LRSDNALDTIWATQKQMAEFFDLENGQQAFMNMSEILCLSFVVNKNNPERFLFVKIMHYFNKKSRKGFLACLMYNLCYINP